MHDNCYIFRGRVFTPEEIAIIKEIINSHWDKGRNGISRIICETFNWRQPNGKLKGVACREALRRMERLKLITLPPPSLSGGYKGLKTISAEDVNFDEPLYSIEGCFKKEESLSFAVVNESSNELLWRFLIQRYHYKGYCRIVGRYLKYCIYLNDGLVALIGIGDAILHHHLRDRWVGWDVQKRKRYLHLIVNNVRFLILPWVKVRNLASKILSEMTKRIASDWQRRYGYKPVLIETFVDASRFKATSYKAGNWIYLGRTEGKGRSGLRYFYHGECRDLFIYPLCKDAREVLLNDGEL